MLSNVPYTVYIVNSSSRSGYGENNNPTDKVVVAENEEKAFELLRLYLVEFAKEYGLSTPTKYPMRHGRDQKEIQAWKLEGSSADHYYWLTKAEIIK